MLSLLGFLIKKSLFFVPQVAGMLSFEAVSFLGRLFARPLSLDESRENFINLGSGPNIVKGFINIDFFNTKGVGYGADLRFPLKIESDTVDGIFCEHTLEHLRYIEVDNLLRECYRILKPNGIIRIVLPDLSLFIKNYCENNQDWFERWEQLIFINSQDSERARRRLLSRIEAISFVTQEYGHVSCWDFASLKAYLEKNHFRNITETGFRQGCCEKLLVDLDEEDRRFVSLYVEAAK